MDALPSLYTIGYLLGESTRQGIHSDHYTKHVHLLLLKIQCINIVHFTVCCIRVPVLGNFKKSQGCLAIAVQDWLFAG